MTLKQARLLKALPKSKTMKEAGEKAGFSSLDIYRKRIKTLIAHELKCEPESIKKHYESLYKLCVTDDDKATAKGILDSLCRITGMNRDRTEIELRSLSPSAISVEELQEARRALAIEDNSSVK